MTRRSAGFYLMVVVPAFVVGCNTPTQRPEWRTTLQYEESELYPTHIGRQGYPFLEIEIANQSVEVFLDTGNMTGLFLSSGTIERLGLPRAGEVVTRDSDGNQIGTKPLYEAASVAAFGDRWSDRQILQRDVRGADGAIGPPYLLGKRYTIDYKGGWLAVTENPLESLPPAANVLELFPVPDLEGMLVVRGSVRGEGVYIQVDTGKTRTCIDPEFARRLELPEATDGFRIDSIRLGSLEFSVSSAKAVGFGGISRGLDEPIRLGIGSDLLQDVLLTVDYRQGVAILQQK